MCLLVRLMVCMRVRGFGQLAINEGSVLHLRNDAARLERDVFVYRSYIGVGNYSVVLDEVGVGRGSMACVTGGGWTGGPFACHVQSCDPVPVCPCGCILTLEGADS